MEEKLERFDEKVNTEVNKILSSLGFKIHDGMTSEDYCQLSRDMGANGVAYDLKSETENGVYRVTIQLTKTLELIL
ncbi:hypothetical protein [Bacillus toyonensis]|jgi:hypothetical protein|uniref:hypothetical protein n=1 Tax=Bacillus toyonensis TaxID=155322 RepID=UPI000BF21244|nr:hypothetical protein [Bacillus toyonensis]PEL23415.1 hypothetical protein CN624_21175 [Bacillus toyonensis]PFY49103.1 hypothetical protein COL55_13430 [Bacillus toyonensis]PFY86062.1 hypothetical protein COL62_02385 [Bacillus toyonensis]PHD51851.1 hypothetical protein COF75_07420 [Bacillus toyonensis]